jgi:hypothetical protein
MSVLRLFFLREKPTIKVSGSSAGFVRAWIQPGY